MKKKNSVRKWTAEKPEAKRKHDNVVDDNHYGDVCNR